MTNTQKSSPVPKISVLMPAYNAEKYITEAIDSILAQTFADFEFIIINDGSTDRTAEIVRSYKDPRIVFVDNEKNQGLITVLNQGMDMARGEYIARMDADDISLPERFAKQIAFMDAHPDVGLLGTQLQIFGYRHWKSSYPEKIGILDIHKINHINHPTVMLRKSVFDKYNLRYNHDYIACEDYELWSRVVRYTKVANLPDVLLKYRLHDANESVKKRELQLKNAERIQENILDYIFGVEKMKNLFRFFIGTQRGISTTVWLFWIIPILRIKSIHSSKKIYLFGIIPLLKIKKGAILLFHIMPVGKIGELK
jgi:glycosyltransferase involved in cell wall biosynthesis